MGTGEIGMADIFQMVLRSVDLITLLGTVRRSFNCLATRPLIHAEWAAHITQKARLISSPKLCDLFRR